MNFLKELFTKKTNTTKQTNTNTKNISLLLFKYYLMKRTTSDYKMSILSTKIAFGSIIIKVLFESIDPDILFHKYYTISISDKFPNNITENDNIESYLSEEEIDHINKIFEEVSILYINKVRLELSKQALDKTFNINEYGMNTIEWSSEYKNKPYSALRLKNCSFEQMVIYFSFIENKEYFDEYKKYVYKMFKMDSDKITKDEPKICIDTYESYFYNKEIYLDKLNRFDEHIKNYSKTTKKLDKYLKEINSNDN